MTDEKIDDLDPTEKVDAPEGGKKPGEGKEGIDYSGMSDEEILELLQQEEKERIASLGLSADEFDSWDKVGKKLKEMMEEDKEIYGDIKERATKKGMSPKQFMQSWKKNGIPPDAEVSPERQPPKQTKEPVAPDLNEVFKQINALMGRSELRTQFELFKLRMEKKGIDVPNKLKSELEKYMTTVAEVNEGDLDGLNLYEEAYPFYEKAEELKKEKKKLSVDKLALKKRQLGISGKGTGGGVTLEVGEASWKGQYEPK